MTQPRIDFDKITEGTIRIARRFRAQGISFTTDDILSNVNAFKIVMANAAKLNDVFDLGVMPIAKELRREGINPAEIRVIVGNRTVAFPEFNIITVSENELEAASYPESVYTAEDLYVTLSHEMGHFLSEQSGIISVEEAEFYHKTIPIHADRPHEQVSVYWEGEQVRKFGWSKNRYRRHVYLLYSGGDPGAVTEREAREQFMELTSPETPSRRPREVHVREHLRRRIVEHLKSPPDYCMCHRSKIVNNLRRRLIRRWDY
jgi:hypothetical protein